MQLLRRGLPLGWVLHQRRQCQALCPASPSLVLLAVSPPRRRASRAVWCGAPPFLLRLPRPVASLVFRRPRAPQAFEAPQAPHRLCPPPPRPGAPPRPSHRPQRCCGSAARLSHARVLARCAPPAQARSVVAARAIAKQPSALTDDMCFFCHTARFLGVLQCTCVFCCLVRCRLAFGSV